MVGMNVEVNFVDCCLKVQFQQEYSNSSSDNIETIYKFVIPKTTTIGDFYAEVGGRKVHGVVQEKGEAQDTYDDALSSGLTSYIASKEEDVSFNSYSISIGNLAPGQKSKVYISFMSVALNKDGRYIFYLPPELLPAKIPVSGCCNIEMTEEVEDVYSTVGVVNPIKNLVEWKLIYSSQPIVIVVTTKKFFQPKAILEYDENTKSKALMITATPVWKDLNTDLIESQVEVIFVVDRSGSMRGSRISQTKQALNILLHALPPLSRFNIIGFGSSQDWLFPESKQFCEENIHIAHEKIQDTNADLGGTDLVSPLRRIFSKPIDIDYPRIILVLTDGSVNDRNGTINEVRRNKEQCRLYSLGISSAVDKTLVNGICEAGRGEAAFVINDSEIEGTVMSLFEKAFQPCTRNIQIMWPENTIQYAPKKIPPIFKGDRLITFGLIEGEIGEYVNIKALDPMGQELDWSVPVEKGNGFLRNKLAAFEIIKQLEADNENNEQTDTKMKIIALAKKYQLVSKYTSFVAVDDQVDTATNTSLKTIKVEVVKPLCNDDFSEDETETRARGMIKKKKKAPKKYDKRKKEKKQEDISEGFQRSEPKQKMVELEKSEKKEEVFERKEKEKERKNSSGAEERKVNLEGKNSNEQKSTLVKAQKFDGCWDIETMCGFLSISLEEIKKHIPEVSEGLWATALAIAFLELYLSESANTWQMVAKKGRAYMIKLLIKEKSITPNVSTQECADLIEKAKAFLKLTKSN
uniref:VWFA domain-containing protein n=1 Tax=Arcella intermedia TaxID=1963864 RepID=A0A6B2KYE4_9EUKA